MAHLRFPIALLLSLILTTGLFGFMRLLTNARSEGEEAAAITKFEFVRLRRSEGIEEKKREKPEIEKAEQETVTPTLAIAEEEGVKMALDVEALAAGLGAEFGSAGGGGGRGEMGGPGFSTGLADRAALPLVRVDPRYPPQAQRQKLEGWVQVRFTISTAGAVKDPSVVESSSEIFEKDAVQAVSKWKYQPQLKAGKPVEVANKRVMVRFQLPKGERS